MLYTVYIMGVDDRKGGIADSLNRIAVRALFLSDNQVLVVEREEGWHCLPGCEISSEVNIIDHLKASLAKQLGVHQNHIEIAPEALSADPSSAAMQQFYTAKLKDPAAVEQERENFKWIDVHDLERFCLSPSLDFIRCKLATTAPV